MQINSSKVGYLYNKLKAKNTELLSDPIWASMERIWYSVAEYKLLCYKDLKPGCATCSFGFSKQIILNFEAEYSHL